MLCTPCRRRGFADEVYRVVVPRHPGAAMSAVATSPGGTPLGAAPLGVPLPQHTSTGGVELAPRGMPAQEQAQAQRSVGQQAQHAQHRLRAAALS